MKPEIHLPTSLLGHANHYQSEADMRDYVADMYTGSIAVLAVIGVSAPFVNRDVSKGLMVTAASAVGIAAGYLRRRVHVRAAAQARKNVQVLDGIITKNIPIQQTPSL